MTQAINERVVHQAPTPDMVPTVREYGPTVAPGNADYERIGRNARMLVAESAPVRTITGIGDFAVGAVITKAARAATGGVTRAARGMTRAGSHTSGARAQMRETAMTSSA